MRCIKFAFFTVLFTKPNRGYNRSKNLLDIPESAKGEKLDYTTINKNKGIIVSYYLKDANALNKDKEKSVKYLQIVWIEDDIIYQMEATGISEDQLLKIAESMK